MYMYFILALHYHSPAFFHLSEDFKTIKVTLPLDIVTLVSPGTPVEELFPLIKIAVCRQLLAMQTCILKSNEVICYSQ